MTTLSTTAASIVYLASIGEHTSKEIANLLGVSVPKVTGSLAGLIGNGVVRVTPTKTIEVTESGMKYVTAPVGAVVEYAAAPMIEVTKSKRGDLKTKASELVQSHPGAPRKVIVALFIEKLGMSASKASTYHYALTGKNGMWVAG